VYSTEFIFIHSFSKNRKYGELLKVLLVVPKVFKNKTSNLTLAAISDSDRPSSSTEKITL